MSRANNKPDTEASPAPFLKLYSHGTGNGQKAAIMLTVLGLNYEYEKMDVLTEMRHKEDWYLKLNLQGKIPVLVDVNEKGEECILPESSAIMLYLGEKFDKENKFYYGVGDGTLYWDQMRWMFFLEASLGAKFFSALYCNLFCPEDIPLMKKTSIDQLKVVLGNYETRLTQNNGWLVGDRANVADLAAYPFLNVIHNIGIDLTTEFPVLRKWFEDMSAIPGVVQGSHIDRPKIPLFQSDFDYKKEA